MNAYPHLKENMDALGLIGHPIYHWLSNQDIDREQLTSNLFMNKWDMHDWRMENGEGMFEGIVPQAAYQGWIPKQKAATSATFVVGCNLGYGLNYLLTNTPDSHKIMVIEPRPEMLLACLGQTDYRPFMEAKKLHFLPPNEDYIMEVIKNLDLQFVYGHINLKADVPSQQLGPEYAQWMKKTKDKLENFSLELTTLRYRQDTMVGNELHNFRRATSDGTLRGLENRGGGVGAVILGAGPSLEQFAPELAKKKGNALYTTALQTLPILQKFGIKPDFCMAIDYDDSMLRVFDRLDMEFAKDIPLIYSTKLNPKVVRKYPGPTLPIWTVGGMGTFVMKQNDLVIDAGGNVSLTLARFLRWCGVSHIMLAGQDFAWINNKSHSEGHHSTQDGFDFIEGFHQRINNLDGEEIITTPQYVSAKRDLEEDLKKAAFPVYNLYGGGIHIEGTRPIDLDKAYRKGVLASAPGSVERFMTELMACRNADASIRFEARSHSWAVSLRNAEKRLTKLFKNLKANQQEINAVLEQVDMFIKQDPLYMPYLYNETVDLAGLTKAKHKYEAKDFARYKGIMKRVIKKVREVDRLVCLNKKEAA